MASNALLSMLTLALLAGCENAESVRIDETRAKLVGSWVREVETGQVKSKRVLVLAADGKFIENIVVTSAGEPPERKEFAGEWSYDGINFKRRFLQENGRQFAGGSIRYATFPLVSVGATELVVDDKIAQTQARYDRVASAASP